jgi:hypothetical protein
MMENESKILSCFGGAATFDTMVMHELGHVLGPGHGADPTSVMDATLGAGTGNRDRTAADRDVPDRDGGGPAGLHARLPLPVPPPTASADPAPPSVNQDVGLMARDPLASLQKSIEEVRGDFTARDRQLADAAADLWKATDEARKTNEEVKVSLKAQTADPARLQQSVDRLSEGIGELNEGVGRMFRPAR